jgi:chromate transporter
MDSRQQKNFSITMIYLELFTTFFFIGLFTIGGGYAMLSLIQAQVVTKHGWITESMFTDIVGISQMTPGPIGINSATYIGYTVLNEAGAGHFASMLGSFTASFAVVLPSFLIVLAIVKAYDRFKENPIFQSVLDGLKPVVVGLIGAAAIMLITPENFPDWKSWIIFAVALAATLIGKINPIIAIIAGGAIGALIY